MSDEETRTAEGGEHSPEEIRAQETEATAREKGWKPEEEYEGPKGGFVGADEFLKREPLFDRIRDLSKNNKKLERAVEAMTTQFSTQVKAQVALRIKELQNAKKEAIKEGDVEAVEQFDAEIEQHKKETVAAPSVPTEVEDWIDENEWFVKDPEMNAWAIAHNKAYVGKNPSTTTADSLKVTADAVKIAFPDKFDKKTTPAAAPPNPVAGTGTPKDTKGSKGYSIDRLSADQKSVYQQMVKTHKVLSHDDYFKGLEEIGELS
jgi:hypothetical protein